MNDKYLKYQLEDFLSDDQFIDWVIANEYDSEWSKWLDDNPSAHNMIEEAKVLIQSIKFKAGGKTNPNLKSDLWERINNNTEAKEIQLRPSFNRRYIIGLAAAAAIALLAIFIIPEKEVTVIAKNTLAEVVTLPSSSTVTVEPSSKISYRDVSWEKERVIDLEGQAHFKVTKGVPFKVITATGNVEVLGTEFDVVSEDDLFYVKVDEGRVSASSGTISEILSGDMAFFRNPAWEGQYAINESWRVEKTIFAFTEKPLEDALSAISFHYNYDINYGPVNPNTLFTGSFNTADGLSSSLQNVLWPLNLTFGITEKVITIESE